jgi:hypothetical protein
MTAQRIAMVSLAAFVWGVCGAAQDSQPTACVACHSNADFFDEEHLAIVTQFQNDVHAAAGLSCHDCHGGNPAPELAEDLGAMDEHYAPNPYRGAPDRPSIPDFCGRCHSDIEYMRRFDPRARVDQEREYWTSQHGMALRRGNEHVATCVDCHHAHGVQGPEDPSSPIYPKQVAETCRGCHANAEVMAGATLPDGRPLPVDQYARWRQSVHAAALLEREDLSAPTCNDCHGNHGATPPGIHSISFVCGQCHGREAETFRASAKWEGFETHNEMLEAAGEEGCAACHEAGPQQTGMKTTREFTECSTCHGNHGVIRPTVAMLSPLPETPCAFCHEAAGGEEGTVLEPRGGQQAYEEMKSQLLAQASTEGLEGEALFDWLVDQAHQLPTHTVESAEAEGGRALKPEFQRLFVKFRIGKTHFTYEDPLTGKTVKAKVVRCGSCHPPDGVGIQAASRLLGEMRGLTTRTARAERILLAARRGGVETGDAELEVDQAVDAQIALQVSVHTFNLETGTDFASTQEQGLQHARNALEAGREALEELRHRRLGLGVSLVFIVLVLIGLGIKIRNLPA